MPRNLLDDLHNLDPTEVRLLLKEYVPGIGQHDGRTPRTLFLPSAGASCRVKVTYNKGGRISSLTEGPAFDATEWEKMSNPANTVGPSRIGRDYSFSSFRVDGWWRGHRSGVQILPPSDDAPRPPFERGEHPFILEFSIISCPVGTITNYRRRRKHRKLTLLLNILLAGRTNFQLRSAQFWGQVNEDDGPSPIRWIQQCYFVNFEAFSDQLSSQVGAPLTSIDSRSYYKVAVHDGRGLNIPDDLDDLIVLYFNLTQEDGDKLDRAMFWMDMAARQWEISKSSSFASLVTAIEALVMRGQEHRVFCPCCQEEKSHDVPSATANFRNFFETYAPDPMQRAARTKMYKYRSNIRNHPV